MFTFNAFPNSFIQKIVL